jgi:hypothetical protein
MEIITPNNNLPMSEDIRSLASAFLLAKNEFRATGLAGTNAHQKYNYAKIGDIYHAVEDALSKNNIIIWHFARPSDGLEYLHTRLVHAPTGQFIEDCRILESEKAGNQAKGAANTYMKKYALLSLCAIATEDDDGEEEARYIAKKLEEPLLSSEQVSVLQSAIKSASNGTKLYDAIKNAYRVQYVSDIKASSFESVRSYIANNRE